MLILIKFAVAPHAGAWIEILLRVKCGSLLLSLPTRERGLKLYRPLRLNRLHLSLPTRERGLKSCGTSVGACNNNVAPHAGAWIEIFGHHVETGFVSRRSPRGSVD